MATVGFLHTAPEHVATFGGLVRDLAPDLDDRHTVREDLLGRARAEGLTADVDRSVGGRVDRPMAEAAMRIGGRVAVVAALASTLEPTRTLLEACATGRPATIELVLSEAAWSLFESGDTVGYLDAVAATVAEVGGRADVVVLAQASMAAAAEAADTGVPVLASPRLAIEAVSARLAADPTR